MCKHIRTVIIHMHLKLLFFNDRFSFNQFINEDTTVVARGITCIARHVRLQPTKHMHLAHPGHRSVLSIQPISQTKKKQSSPALLAYMHFRFFLLGTRYSHKLPLHRFVHIFLLFITDSILFGVFFLHRNSQKKIAILTLKFGAWI